jgi:SAM-dependent methyltransferase
VLRFGALVKAGGTVLDVACGSGRHLRWLAAQGHAVTGVDRDAAALEPLRALGEIVVADIEDGPWPFEGRRFDGILVTNYLWRALAPHLLGSLAEGGVLIHETFATGQQTIGKPSRPEFLLDNGELLHLYPGLRVVAFEDGFEAAPPRFVQRLAAVKLAPGGSPPPRLAL